MAGQERSRGGGLGQCMVEDIWKVVRPGGAGEGRRACGKRLMGWMCQKNYRQRARMGGDDVTGWCSGARYGAKNGWPVHTQCEVKKKASGPLGCQPFPAAVQCRLSDWRQEKADLAT